MNQALLATSRLLPSFLGLSRWWSGEPPRASRLTPKTHRGSVIELVPKYVAPQNTNAQKLSTQKPLRVIRVLESGQSVANVGRMVISGRMADVCDELDRLAAGEVMAS